MCPWTANVTFQFSHHSKEIMLILKGVVRTKLNNKNKYVACDQGCCRYLIKAAIIMHIETPRSEYFAVELVSVFFFSPL